MTCWRYSLWLKDVDHLGTTVTIWEEITDLKCSWRSWIYSEDRLMWYLLGVRCDIWEQKRSEESLSLAGWATARIMLSFSDRKMMLRHFQRDKSSTEDLIFTNFARDLWQVWQGRDVAFLWEWKMEMKCLEMSTCRLYMWHPRTFKKVWWRREWSISWRTACWQRKAKRICIWFIDIQAIFSTDNGKV